MILVIRDRPTKPPSLVSLQEPEVMNFCPMVAAVLRNKNFLCILASFSALDGVFIGIGVVLDPFFEGLKLPSSAVSIFGGIFVVTGVMSSLVFGFLLDKYRRYLLTLRIITFGSLLAFAICYGTFSTFNIWIIGINTMLAGILIVPILPVGTAFAGEVTFPMQEAVVIGLLQMVGQVAGLVIGFISSLFFITNQTPFH